MADDFFAQETREAKAALKNLVREARDSIGRNTDMRPLIRQRPWTSLAAAAAGGLVTGLLATPPRRSPQEKQRVREAAARRHHTAGEILQRQLLGAINPVLRTFATTAAVSLFHRDGGHDSQYHENMESPRMQI